MLMRAYRPLKAQTWYFTVISASIMSSHSQCTYAFRTKDNDTISFLGDLHICCHGLGGGHYLSRLCFTFLIQEVESLSVLWRDVLGDVGICRWLNGPSLAVERVNGELGFKSADTDELWHRTRRECLEAIAHFIVSQGSGGGIREKTRCFHVDEEDGDMPFTNDVADMANRGVFRGSDPLCVGCYLVVRRSGMGKSVNRRVLKAPYQTFSIVLERSMTESCSKTYSGQVICVIRRG